MDPRNYKSGAAASPPDAPAAPSTGYPTEGNPGSGVPATNPGPFWYYKVGESLRNLIVAGGVAPDDSNLSAITQAVLNLVSATNHVVRLEDVTFGPSVADGDAVYWDNANSRYDRAIADGTDKQKMVGFADVTNSLVEAFGRSALFSGLTAGSKYYLSGSTAGAITTTAPSEKVVVGLAKSATVMFVDIDPIDKGLGDDQSWQDVLASRSSGITYTNSTGKPIFVSIEADAQSAGQTAVVDGIKVAEFDGTANEVSTVSFIVPDGSNYSATATILRTWAELR